MILIFIKFLEDGIPPNTKILGILRHYVMNKDWHEKNKMPKNASFEERIKWYMEHNKNCSRRLGFPKKLEGEIKKEGVKFS